MSADISLISTIMVLSSQLGSAEGLSIIIHGLTLLGTEGTSRVVKRAFFQYLLDSVTWSRLRLILIPMIRLRGEGVGKTKQNKTKKKKSLSVLLIITRGSYTILDIRILGSIPVQNKQHRSFRRKSNLTPESSSCISFKILLIPQEDIGGLNKGPNFVDNVTPFIFLTPSATIRATGSCSAFWNMPRGMLIYGSLP